MVTALEARRLAMDLPEATEQDHHGMPSFRVRNKIFATMPDDRHLHVFVGADDTAAAVAERPDAFAELWWGKQLSGVRVTLSKAPKRLLAELLDESWCRRAPKRLIAERDG